MDSLKFQKNWNNKCNCDFFTTIRLKGPKYTVGKELEMKIYKGGVFQTHGTVRVAALRPLLLHQINEYISRLDSGLSPDELKQEIYYMYKEKVTDVNKANFVLILCERVKSKPVQNALFENSCTSVHE